MFLLGFLFPTTLLKNFWESGLVHRGSSLICISWYWTYNKHTYLKEMYIGTRSLELWSIAVRNDASESRLLSLVLYTATKCTFSNTVTNIFSFFYQINTDISHVHCGRFFHECIGDSSTTNASLRTNTVSVIFLYQLTLWGILLLRNLLISGCLTT